MDVDFSPRINVLTGDNGLGKSFILDVAWWALTQAWVGSPAWPRPEASEAYIGLGLDTDDNVRFDFNFDRQIWATSDEIPKAEVLTVFARVDGGFSVWDPFREADFDAIESMNSLRSKGHLSFNFDSRQIWEGLKIGSRSVCEGAERDWVKWQEGRKPEFKSLTEALAILSPLEEKLMPGPPMRVFVGEGFERPTIETPTGIVPVALASAGVRRILALAYLLVWTVSEHRIAAKQKRREPAKRLMLLFDEPETHLHPKWQRTIVRSVLAAILELTGIEIQLITATHSPLVLASLEPIFDPSKDSLIDLHLEGEELQVSPIPWRRRGDVTAWLTSEIFDLKSARSVEAEQALQDAATVLGNEPPDPAKAKAIDQRLRGLLGEMDPFWIRWRYLGEKQGWLE